MQRTKVAAAAILAATLVAIIFLAASGTRLPLLILEPGPTKDAGANTHIQAPTFRSKGAFLLTTAVVREPRGASLPEAFRAGFKSDQDVVTRESIFPSSSSRTQTEQVHSAQMSESQESAAVAALHELGIGTEADGAFVREVNNKAPASKVLQAGDVVIKVEDEPVIRIEDLTSFVGRRRAGDTVRLTIQRGDQQKTFRVKTIPGPKSKTRIGVSVVQDQKLPFDIQISASEIGGPSAGLMFSLAIYDALTEGDLTAGRKIAGTGSIANGKGQFGVIEPVGAIRQKVKGARASGATVFLAPEANLEQAREAAEGTNVIGVSTLKQAIERLEITKARSRPGR